MPHCTPLETVLRRDRAVVVAGLCAVAALAWAYTVYLAQGMGHMDMGMELAMPHMQSWNAMDFLSMFLVATIAAFILVEKAVPRGDRVGRVAGGVLSLAGLIMLFQVWHQG